MKKIVVTCPAKIHLLGEHAVVYGKPALLATLDKNITVTLVSAKTRGSFRIKNSDEDLSDLQKIIEDTIKEKHTIENIPPYTLEIVSDVPFGMGLGSSAAISAAVSASLLSFLDIVWDNKMVFEIAYEGERLFHGNPSGGDLAAVIGGGLLYFRKEFEFLKTFSTLPFNVHKNMKQFVMIDSGKPTETTREMVEKVATLKKRFPKKVDLIFNNQETLTREMVLALRAGEEEKLMQCIREGEKNLEALGAVSSKTKKLIKMIETLGGVAKISGGGGYKSGCGMLLCYHPNPEKLHNFAKEQNIYAEKITIDATGLTQIYE